MEYRVRLTHRASRDLETIYQFIHADSSHVAFSWFNQLAEKIGSLEHYADRGSTLRENRKYRQLLFGQKPGVHRIIYDVDKRNRIVAILQIRHAARDIFTDRRAKTSLR